MKQYFVYIMTNRKHGVLYTGMTNNIERRVQEHKEKTMPCFTSKYNCTKLVWYDGGNDVRGVIAREKEIKGWLRSKKIALIESMNPEWNDLSEGWYEECHAERSAYSFCHVERKPEGTKRNICSYTGQKEDSSSRLWRDSE